jgi:hypothetical protein
MSANGDEDATVEAIRRGATTSSPSHSALVK